MSPFDAWLTEEPWDRICLPEAEYPEPPDPCIKCDSIGNHGPECPRDPDPWTEFYLGPGVVENPVRVVRSENPALYAHLLNRWAR